MKYRALLLVGAPGSGKGTQGKVLGSIPGFFHFSSGDVFRNLDLRTEFGKAYLQYSRVGKLVPDDLTMELWSTQIQQQKATGRYKPEIDHLVLDGIPRNLNQAKLMSKKVEIEKVFHLDCPNRDQLFERLRRRALKENRIDDASDEVIAHRLKVYDKETKPVLDFYGSDKVVTIDALKWPYQVLRDILEHLE